MKIGSCPRPEADGGDARQAAELSAVYIGGVRLRQPSSVFRRSWRPRHVLVACPVGLIVVVVVVDILAPPDVHLGPLLVAAPAMTAAIGGARLVAPRPG
ncbi:hypothetical protein ACFVJH_34735 [Streptomyces decoyicus]|uniref:hypothetical protein n=1 Tax=Streptomyces decoyicus TaxID=249567 RepID=UPI003636CEE0